MDFTRAGNVLGGLRSLQNVSVFRSACVTAEEGWTSSCQEVGLQKADKVEGDFETEGLR